MESNDRKNFSIASPTFHKPYKQNSDIQNLFANNDEKIDFYY